MQENENFILICKLFCKTTRDAQLHHFEKLSIKTSASRLLYHIDTNEIFHYTRCFTPSIPFEEI